MKKRHQYVISDVLSVQCENFYYLFAEIYGIRRLYNNLKIPFRSKIRMLRETSTRRIFSAVIGL